LVVTQLTARDHFASQSSPALQVTAGIGGAAACWGTEAQPNKNGIAHVLANTRSLAVIAIQHSLSPMAAEIVCDDGKALVAIEK
jgi:hypothetical protein